METKYKIIDTEFSDYKYIVFSLDYSRIEEYVIKVASILQKKSYKGSVLFDLLLSNGGKENRFYSAFFDGFKFDFKSFKPYRTMNNDLLQFSNTFYRNSNYLDNLNHVLSKHQRFVLENSY